nr:hypothetical protein [Tanacetum cinerariifolium]
MAATTPTILFIPRFHIKVTALACRDRRLSEVQASLRTERPSCVKLIAKGHVDRGYWMVNILFHQQSAYPGHIIKVRHAAPLVNNLLDLECVQRTFGAATTSC